MTATGDERAILERISVEMPLSASGKSDKGPDECCAVTGADKVAGDAAKSRDQMGPSWMIRLGLARENRYADPALSSTPIFLPLPAMRDKTSLHISLAEPFIDRAYSVAHTTHLALSTMPPPYCARQAPPLRIDGGAARAASPISPPSPRRSTSSPMSGGRSWSRYSAESLLLCILCLT